MFNDEIWNVFLDYPHHMVTDHLENNIITHLKDFVSDFMDEKTIDDWIQNNLDDSLKELKLKRSYMTFMKTIEEQIACRCDIKEHIQHLQELSQPEQRTPEWYDFRANHITASNAWKAYSEKEKVRNQIIYEKCKPMEVKKYGPSLSETPMTWGHKYEPLSVKLYEMWNDTTISEFGCIEHPKHKFLAASPDGIVTGNNNYGRMIEIKNVVSREINGIPKHDYYVQMQIQMEVCDLDDCDFVETKFTEYGSYEDYLKDGSFKLSLDEKQKGIIKVYIENEAYVYEYMNLSCSDPKKWLDEEPKEGWLKNVYWKLEVYSCVFVPRCKAWFDLTLNDIQDTWAIILKERESGDYMLRQPTKRVKKEEVHLTSCSVAEKDFEQSTC